MSKHPLLWFYVLAFGISWLGWVPVAVGSHGIAPFDRPEFQFLLILPALGPALAALIVTWASLGRERAGDLFKALIQWRVGWFWILVAVFGPLVLLAAGRALTGLFGFPVTSAAPQGDLIPLAVSALVMSLFSNPWEEVGWRGFALPRLQKRYTALSSTLVVGGLWGLWHLPLFFWIGNPFSEHPFLPWFIGTVASAFLYTWIYNSTRGSLFPVTLFHIALNTWGVVIFGVSVIALAIVEVLAALVILMAFGGASLSSQARVRLG